MDLHGSVVYQLFITMVKLENVILQQVQDNDPDQKIFVDLLLRLNTENCLILDWKSLINYKLTSCYLNKFVEYGKTSLS
jgi:hypothetical protein